MMGQCGCGDMGPVQTFPGPDGSVYALDIYGGCADCKSPVGVRLYRFYSESDRRLFDIDDAPQLEFGPDPGCAYIPVLLPAALVPKVKEAFAGIIEHWLDDRKIYELLHGMQEDPNPAASEEDA